MRLLALGMVMLSLARPASGLDQDRGQADGEWTQADLPPECNM